MDLEDKYPGTNPEALKILSSMLEFNPNKRISAEEALKNPYFDEVRIPEQETFVPCEIDLHFDE